MSLSKPAKPMSQGDHRQPAEAGSSPQNAGSFFAQPSITSRDLPVSPKKDLIRLLIVDDSEADVEVLSRMLRGRFGDRAQIVDADCASAALDHLERADFDVVLVDYLLPDMNGLEVIAALKTLAPHAVAILLTGQGNESIAAQAFRQGARDYLIKRDLTPAILERVVKEALDGGRQARGESLTLQELERSHREMDHFVRAISHDMTAHFLLLEHSFRHVQSTCRAASGEGIMPDLLEDMVHLESCLRESKRFIDDLVTLSKTGRLDSEPERVPLAEAAQETLAELRPLLEQRQITARAADNLPVVWCHRGRLKQVLSNLIRNAALHGCANARGEIRVENSRAAGSYRPGYAWIRVWDNGEGIPATLHETIFLPGRRGPRAAAPGSGMGLAIVRRMVEQAGGTVDIDASCTKGTAFALSLPLPPQANA